MDNSQIPQLPQPIGQDPATPQDSMVSHGAPMAAPHSSGSMPQPPLPGVANFGQPQQYVHPASQQPLQGDFAKQVGSIPPEANDVDVIEKEWVNHLKDIAARTASNPFAQQSEISRAKADYMKKRYNKDIKVTEG